MKIRFIEESNQDNILCETENEGVLSAVFVPFTQIHITTEKEVLVCEYGGYNALSVVENEIDIFVNITDSKDLPEKKDLYKMVLENKKPKRVKISMKKNILDMHD